MLDVAKISIKGQVTIPVEIRKKLGLKEGDEVVSMEKGGDIVLLNPNRLAFEEFQCEMAGEAETSGLNSEQDVVDLVRHMRLVAKQALKTWQGKSKMTLIPLFSRVGKLQKLKKNG